MAVLKRCNNFKLLPVLAPKYNLQVTATRNLNLQEYHSKDLLRKHQVSIQDFRILDISLDPKPISDFKADEYVIKAQILAGGRGKGYFDNGFKGGVHLTKNPGEILSLAKNMLGHKLITKQTPKEGILVDKVMVAESVNIKRETYLSIIMDRSFNGAALVASPAGGMDIEQVAEETPHLLKTIPIDVYEGVTDKIANDIAEFLQFKGDLEKECAAEVKKLWNLFQKVSCYISVHYCIHHIIICIQIEINIFLIVKYSPKDVFTNSAMKIKRVRADMGKLRHAGQVQPEDLIRPAPSNSHLYKYGQVFLI